MDDAVPEDAHLSAEQDDFARALARTVLYFPRSFTADLGRDHGMTSTEFFTLAHLSFTPDGRARMGDLAAAAALSLSATTRVVGQLARAGYVVKVRAEGDGRGWQAQLTDAGRAWLEDSERTRVVSLRSRVFDRLDGVDLAPLTDVLNRIVDGDEPAPPRRGA